MYRSINAQSGQELPLRMLFQRAGDGVFYRACEADGYGGLVAAILDDPGYEMADIETRLEMRLRLATDVRFLAEVEGEQVVVGDTDRGGVVNVHSDKELIDSLQRIGYVSVAPTPQ